MHAEGTTTHFGLQFSQLGALLKQLGADGTQPKGAYPKTSNSIHIHKAPLHGEHARNVVFFLICVGCSFGEVSFPTAGVQIDPQEAPLALLWPLLVPCRRVGDHQVQ